MATHDGSEDRVAAWFDRQDDELRLELEAGRLHDAWSHDGERWDDLDDSEREPFRAVAREARRLHGGQVGLADREPAPTAEGGDGLHEYYAAERERMQREHGGKLLAVWVRRGAQWYALASSGFEAEIGLADLAEMGDLVFGEPPGDGLWVWSGAYESKQTGYEEVEYEDVALGEWRRPTPGELARLGAGVEPWTELGLYKVSFEGGSYLVAASTADLAIALAGQAASIGPHAGAVVGYRKLSANELSSTQMVADDLSIVTLADMLADTTWPCVLVDTKEVR